MPIVLDICKYPNSMIIILLVVFFSTKPFILSFVFAIRSSLILFRRISQILNGLDAWTRWLIRMFEGSFEFHLCTLFRIDKLSAL